MLAGRATGFERPLASAGGANGAAAAVADGFRLKMLHSLPIHFLMKPDLSVPGAGFTTGREVFFDTGSGSIGGTMFSLGRLSVDRVLVGLCASSFSCPSPNRCLWLRNGNGELERVGEGVSCVSCLFTESFRGFVVFCSEVCSPSPLLEQ